MDEKKTISYMGMPPGSNIWGYLGGSRDDQLIVCSYPTPFINGCRSKRYLLETILVAHSYGEKADIPRRIIMLEMDDEESKIIIGLFLTMTSLLPHRLTVLTSSPQTKNLRVDTPIRNYYGQSLREALSLGAKEKLKRILIFIGDPEFNLTLPNVYRVNEVRDLKTLGEIGTSTTAIIIGNPSILARVFIPNIDMVIMDGIDRIDGKGVRASKEVIRMMESKVRSGGIIYHLYDESYMETLDEKYPSSSPSEKIILWLLRLRIPVSLTMSLPMEVVLKSQQRLSKMKWFSIPSYSAFLVRNLPLSIENCRMIAGAYISYRDSDDNLQQHSLVLRSVIALACFIEVADNRLFVQSDDYDRIARRTRLIGFSDIETLLDIYWKMNNDLKSSLTYGVLAKWSEDHALKAYSIKTFATLFNQCVSIIDAEMEADGDFVHPFYPIVQSHEYLGEGIDNLVKICRDLFSIGYVHNRAIHVRGDDFMVRGVKYERALPRISSRTIRKDGYYSKDLTIGEKGKKILIMLTV